jgi:hypothetical protein
MRRSCEVSWGFLAFVDSEVFTTTRCTFKFLMRDVLRNCEQRYADTCFTIKMTVSSCEPSLAYTKKHV